MLHQWFYKKIGVLPGSLLEKLVILLPNLEYYSMTVDVNNSNTKNYSFGGYLYDARPNREFQILKHEILLNLQNYFEKNGHKGTNVARLGPRTYIKEHSDFNSSNETEFQLTTVKLQIPIITNDHVALMWATRPSDTQVGVFDPGGIYIIDNIKPHSVVNLGNSSRYWITSRWESTSIRDPLLLKE